VDASLKIGQDMSTHDAAPRAGDPDHFRRTLGHFPTGVVVITAVDGFGRPAGLSVGSFTSVSLDPPARGVLPGPQLDVVAEEPDRPLVFYRGGYGALTPRGLSR
jgi:flavin reductase (DIM6/NTAB) family NADH-FMN oxidoreductase RutF